MKDNYVIFISVLILLVGAISFNYGGLTGNAVKDYISNIEVNPGNLINNGVLSITIEPGKAGIRPDLNIYTESGLRIANLHMRVCKYSKCYDPVVLNKRINLGDFDFRGKFGFYIEGEDIFYNRPVRTYFTIKP